ncbi:MAG: glutamate--tRNA ligase [Candidatus Muproteobacteria bacterium RBG_16_62_13]|uniref:Glutamate--tRNA ligase n=1 Tax=Candidatus Muproteobacteria bacterium RBG_16_62_13 TaxID=1817756 RepID=A0A1F6T7C4_9PROT|nr:MAG: glutamate--tRNA ligase [Candidatus Muproteobacteria bacterium RBG_16_62_13]
MTTAFRTRFAPSPTGLLHLGNVRTALFNWLLARGRGRFMLRIEDTDAMRGHERYTQALMEDLRWLGLDWQEGPSAGGQSGPYLQSERGAIYQTYFDRLHASGQAYPCFCSEHELSVSRKTALAAGRPPRYSGKCRSLTPAEVQERFAAGTPATLRFRVEEGRALEFSDGVRGPQRFASDDIGDFIIRRSDGTPAFFFCNAIDDALMGVTLVVRGEDHLTNTPRQILLLQALGLPVPGYAHIALVVGGDGAPLSKRTGSKSVQELRESGYLPGAVNNYLARLGHTYESNEYLDADGLARAFSAAHMHKSPARYDEAQLKHWQHQAVRQATADELWKWMGAEVQALVPEPQRNEFIETVRGNLTFPADALRWARVAYDSALVPGHEARAVIDSAGPGFYDVARRALETHGTDFRAISQELKKQLGVSGKALFQPLRAALTGELDGPEMARLLPLIGAGRAKKRLTV